VAATVDHRGPAGADLRASVACPSRKHNRGRVATPQRSFPSRPEVPVCAVNALAVRNGSSCWKASSRRSWQPGTRILRQACPLVGHDGLGMLWRAALCVAACGARHLRPETRPPGVTADFFRVWWTQPAVASSKRARERWPRYVMTLRHCGIPCGSKIGRAWASSRRTTLTPTADWAGTVYHCRAILK
jgi:hypothetical protein